MKKLCSLAFAAVLVSSSALGQVTSMVSANAAPKSVNPKDLNKVVCEVDSTTGTRLENRKVCKTVLQWQDMRREHRESVESIQRYGTSVGCQEGQACVPGG